MRRRSSGSSEDGDTSPVEVPHVGSRDTEPRQPAPTTSTQQPHSDRSTQQRPPSARSRRPTSNVNWKSSQGRNGSLDKVFHAATVQPTPTFGISPASTPAEPGGHEMEKTTFEPRVPGARLRLRNPWTISIITLITSALGIALLAAILDSLVTRQLDPKGCRMSYMRPAYARLNDFDTEHTRLASKYSLYLYREEGIDDDVRVKGIPVLFIPGNAGSYKQVRPIAAEAANYFHDVLQHDEAAMAAGVRSLDFFTVDFNEDLAAFHGQTILDQAEYLNEAVRYILSLYLDPRMSNRNSDLPDPTSVILLGHSMGGIVARTMLIMPNYQSNSINTIVTMSAPHARPPVSFDGQLVKIYREINDYWRHAYSQQWANNNPLWHVTLVSIAGGGLDTIVPSDYTSVESLVPDTHGFTVFTTSIPTVWTSMDHQAIMWCDQFRKVVAKALHDVVDVNRATQTKPRAERMRVFKKWFLTGMEEIAERTVPLKEPTTLLTLEDNSNSIVAQGERLALKRLGEGGKARAHLLPIPPPGSPQLKRFTLLTDVKLDESGGAGKLEVLFCSVFPLHASQAGMPFAINLDLSGDGTGSTRLACKNAASDVITLPASKRSTKFPFYLDNEPEILPFSYLQYDVEDIAEHQFVAVVDKATSLTPGFVLAEFSNQSSSHVTRHISLRRLLAFGMNLQLGAGRPMVEEVRVPSLESSLLAYNLEIGSQSCGDDAELFTPLVRQYLAEPYESKYFVNARHATISLHGVAPYIPPPLRPRTTDRGLSFQFWTDPTCDSSIQIRLTVDPMGSLGKLYMRYRTVFAAFPLLIVALVMRKQFRVYDSQGVFITFSESMDLCLRQSIPVLLASLTVMSLSGSGSSSSGESFWHWRNGTSTAIDFHQNDLLLGTQDPFFWFIIPLVGLICVGACVVLNYAVLLLTWILGTLLSLLSFRPGWTRNEDRRKAPSTGFLSSSPRRRMITTAILLLLVSTVIPYQFAYLVACLVQLTTTVRAHRIAGELRSTANYNFYNYVHSILILMLWVLPINLPILVVWIHNLAVQWFTPFSSHHNVLSIMPFIVLVETLTTGKMVPRVTSSLKHVTSVFLFGIAIYAAVYGVSYAYMIHYLVNLVAGWLVIIHSTSDKWSISGISNLYEGTADDRKRGKEP